MGIVAGVEMAAELGFQRHEGLRQRLTQALGQVGQTLRPDSRESDGESGGRAMSADHVLAARLSIRPATDPATRAAAAALGAAQVWAAFPLTCEVSGHPHCKLKSSTEKELLDALCERPLIIARYFSQGNQACMILLSHSCFKGIKPR